MTVCCSVLLCSCSLSTEDDFGLSVELLDGRMQTGSEALPEGNGVINRMQIHAFGRKL